MFHSNWELQVVLFILFFIQMFGLSAFDLQTYYIKSNVETGHYGVSRMATRKIRALEHTLLHKDRLTVVRI